MEKITTLEELKTAFREIIESNVGGAEGLFYVTLFEGGSKDLEKTVKKEFCSNYGFKEQFFNLAWTCIKSGKKEEYYKSLIESMLTDPNYKTQ